MGITFLSWRCVRLTNVPVDWWDWARHRGWYPLSVVPYMDCSMSSPDGRILEVSL